MLEKLFTSKTRVKILEYLLFHKGETYLREIARELQTSPGAVKREIDNLHSLGLIRKQKGKVVLDEANTLVEDLRKIFLKTDSIAYPIKEALENPHIDFVLIFGSFAQGKYNSESDVDLLVIGDIAQEEVFRLLRPVEEKIKREINPVVWTRKELKKNRKKGFVRDILKKEPLILKGDVDEFRRIVE